MKLWHTLEDESDSTLIKIAKKSIHHTFLTIEDDAAIQELQRRGYEINWEKETITKRKRR